MTSPSPVLALCQALSTDTGVQALVPVGSGPYGYNIFDHELPVGADSTMPGQGIVVRRHAGPANPTMLQLHYGRIQIVSYGQTPSLADQVYWAARAALRLIQSQLLASTYVHSCVETLAAGPSTRDPTLQWPFNISLWLVRASDLHPPGTP